MYLITSGVNAIVLVTLMLYYISRWKTFLGWSIIIQTCGMTHAISVIKQNHGFNLLHRSFIDSQDLIILSSIFYEKYFRTVFDLVLWRERTADVRLLTRKVYENLLLNNVVKTKSIENVAHCVLQPVMIWFIPFQQNLEHAQWCINLIVSTKNGQYVSTAHCCTDDNKQFTECGSAWVATCSNATQMCIRLLLHVRWLFSSTRSTWP